MNNSIEPNVSTWYRHRGDGRFFQVIALDEDEAVVELQHFDGDIEAVSLGEWHEMDLQAAEPPEDWSGALEDVRGDDVGYSEARSVAETRGRMQERRRRALQHADGAVPAERVDGRPEAWTSSGDDGSEPRDVAPAVGQPGLLNGSPETDLRHRLELRDRALRGDIERELRKYEDDDYGRLADGVKDTGEQSLTDLLSDVDLAEVQRDLEELTEVDAALRRLDDGSYGTCMDCGQAISAARLSARPESVRCIECRRALESERHVKRSRTL